MIKLHKVIDKVHEKYHGDNRVEKNLRLVEDYILKSKETKPSKWEFDEKFWTESKPQLLAETNQKCAYCEVPTKVVADGDVEHYRPKSKYWWLAYTYDNYLAACVQCNQRFKRDHFPILKESSRWTATIKPIPKTVAAKQKAARLLSPDPCSTKGGMTWSQYKKKHTSEKSLLINPYLDEPEEVFAYAWDHVLKTVEVVAKQPKFEAHVEHSCEVYGLNRQELKDLRYLEFLQTLTLKMTLEDPGISAHTKAFNRATYRLRMESGFAFAGMNRYIDTLDLDELLDGLTPEMIEEALKVS
jgi:uncharacterized protein (TIGR02646 family)